jgi:hypothetical protein
MARSCGRCSVRRAPATYHLTNQFRISVRSVITMVRSLVPVSALSIGCSAIIIQGVQLIRSKSDLGNYRDLAQSKIFD